MALVTRIGRRTTVAIAALVIVGASLTLARLSWSHHAAPVAWATLPDPGISTAGSPPVGATLGHGGGSGASRVGPITTRGRGLVLSFTCEGSGTISFSIAGQNAGGSGCYAGGPLASVITDAEITAAAADLVVKAPAGVAWRVALNDQPD